MLYGQARTITGELLPQIVCTDVLCIEYEAYKLVLKDRLNYKCKQQSEPTSKEQKLDRKIKSKEALESIKSMRKLIHLDKDIKSYK